jgi:hypothetical protein
MRQNLSVLKVNDGRLLVLHFNQLAAFFTALAPKITKLKAIVL